MNKKREISEHPIEKIPFATFTKTWKLFGLFSFSIEQTVGEEEFSDTVSRKVLDEINAELNKKFAPPSKNQ